MPGWGNNPRFSLTTDPRLVSERHRHLSRLSAGELWGGNPRDSESSPRPTAGYLGQQPPGEKSGAVRSGHRQHRRDRVERRRLHFLGRYLFFSRHTGDSWDEADAGDVLWVDGAVIEKMRP